MSSVLQCHGPEPEPDNDSADEQDTSDEQGTGHNWQDSCAAKAIQCLTFKVLLLTGGRQPTNVCILFPGLFAEFCIQFWMSVGRSIMTFCDVYAFEIATGTKLSPYYREFLSIYGSN